MKSVPNLKHGFIVALIADVVCGRFGSAIAFDEAQFTLNERNTNVADMRVIENYKFLFSFLKG